jgi:uncharacterized protein YgiM (DUF1202 family)
MSDDFNKLRPPDDDSDDETFDWQSEKPNEPKGKDSGGQLGFTGQLDWRQDVEDAFNKQLDNADDDQTFDWQKDQPSSKSADAGSSGSGLTGELDWQKVRPGSDAPQTTNQPDPLDWLAAADEDEFEPPAQDNATWLQQPDEDDFELPVASSGAPRFQQPDDDEFDAPAQDMPSWLQQPDEDEFDAPEADEEPAAQPDLSMWFQSTASADKNVMEEDALGGEEPPDWLRMPDTGALTTPVDTTEAEADVPPWLQAQDDDLALPEQFTPPDLAPVKDDVPSWMQMVQDEPADDEQPVAAGLEDEGMDWLRAMDDSEPAAQAPAAEVPSWLKSLNDDEEEDAPVAPLQSAPSSDVPDWLEMPDDDQRSVTADDFPDWLTGDDQPAASASTQSRTSSKPQDIFAELGLDFSGEQQSSAPSAPVQPKAGGKQDIFGELGLESPATGYDFLDEQPDDPLSGLNLEGQSSSSDWFTEEESPAQTSDVPNWLQDLGDLSPADAEPVPEPADADFMAQLRGDDFNFNTADDDFALPDFDPSAPALQDIDSLLASYGTELPESTVDTGSLFDANLDQLLSDKELERISSRRGGTGQLGAPPPEVADLLSQLGASVDEVSAAAILRKQSQRERPVDDLSDRLYALREHGLELSTEKPEEPAAANIMKTLLPGVTEVLSAAPIKTGATGISGDVALSEGQRKKIDALKALVGVEDAPRPTQLSAIDLTLDSPNMADMLDEDNEPDLGDEEPTSAPQGKPQPASARKRRRRLPLKIDRLLITLFLTVMVALPFIVKGLHIGNLPSSRFDAGSHEQSAFDRLERLQSGDLALIGVEYGPTGAGELDVMTDVIVRHILARGARPVLVSTNPIGLLHARNVIERINDDTAFLTVINNPELTANQDYYVLRYLAGSAVGLRTLSQDIPTLTGTDVNGLSTNLRVASVADFAAVVVIAERAEDLRSWAEQVAPAAGKSLIGATSYAAAPLSEPYVMPGSAVALSGLQGLLVGYQDAYTYRHMLDVKLFPQLFTPELTTPEPITPAATIETPVLTPETTETPSPVATEITPASAETAATAETLPTSGGATAAPATAVVLTDTPVPTATDTPAPSATSVPTDTPVPAATLAPTDTPALTATSAVSATTAPTEPPTATSGGVIRGVINTTTAINVRQGPGTTFPPLAVLQPGAIVQVTGRNGDGKWLKIKIADGREGWVSVALVAVEAGGAEPSPTPEQKSSRLDPNAVVGLMSDSGIYFYQTTPDATVEATSEVTAETTAEATVQATVAPTAVASASIPRVEAYRDERWYGMTFGLIAIIAVIALGAAVNLIRSLFRRERR